METIKQIKTSFDKLKADNQKGISEMEYYERDKFLRNQLRQWFYENKTFEEVSRKDILTFLKLNSTHRSVPLHVQALYIG